jgi:hypothetical protein
MPLLGFHVQRAVGAHVRSDDVRSVETGGGEKPSFIVFDVIDDGGIDGPGCVDVEARLPAPRRPIVAEADERPRLTYADLHDEGAGKAADIHRFMVTGLRYRHCPSVVPPTRTGASGDRIGFPL